jgi:spore germination cell wall hydrolase CwlJ-like protein
MRVQRLCVLALACMAGAAQVQAVPFVTAPRCFASFPPEVMTSAANILPPILHRRQGVPTQEERDYLIRTLAFEAPYEPDMGKVAVVHVILNRTKSGRWGDNIKDVVTQPWQFEPWMTRRKEIEKLASDDPRYLDAARIADSVLEGAFPDPTAGATHFLNPEVVRKRRGGSLPTWASGEGQPIGRHTFYAPYDKIGWKSDAFCL